MVNIEIDGVSLEVPQGSMIIEAADKTDIHIPRFCYHKKLSVAANCRMCLVEVANSPKPVPACATPVAEGMKVSTRSQKALAAQRSVMEFLLINHPLDCPICDQGGECELQDLSLGYGKDISRYNEGKRVVKDKDIGPLIATEMTRCIHCTRCVRFGTEVAGIRELGAVGRGEHMEISTFIEKSIDSEVSGNIIDVCPVGALTSKPFRFQARAWELQQKPSIAPHDCLGSNVYLHTRRNKVLRVVPRENEAINEVWLSDRDRFSYEALNSPHRLTTPMIKRQGTWQAVGWQEALDYTVQLLQQTLKTHGPDQLGGLIHPSATTEEHYLCQKILRDLGSPHIDHRLRVLDVRDQAHEPALPTLGCAIADLQEFDDVLLIGSNLRKEQPLAALRLRKATRQGKVMSINPVAYKFNFRVNPAITVAPNAMVLETAAVAKALLAISSAPIAADYRAHLVAQLQDIVVTEQHQTIARRLYEAPKAAVFLGAIALHHPQASRLKAWAEVIGVLSSVDQTTVVGVFSHGANSAGAYLAGAIPHRGAVGAKVIEGLSADAMLRSPRKAYLLFGVEPELDCAAAAAARAAMLQAEAVIAFSAFNHSPIMDYAHVVLPLALFAENEGRLINAAAQCQLFEVAVTAPGEARPGWKILRVLANHLSLAGYDYQQRKDVGEELWQQMQKKGFCLESTRALQWPALAQLSLPIEQTNTTWQRITEVPMYALDPMTRRAESLQQTMDSLAPVLGISASSAKKHGLQEGAPVAVQQAGRRVVLPMAVDARLPADSVWIAAGVLASAELNSSEQSIELHAVEAVS